MSSVDELPIGTVTFLFTDIEGSTKLLKHLGGERYGDVLTRHQLILREVFAESGGHEIDTQGDSFFVAFRRAKEALSAAIACQRRLAEHSWSDGAELRVRIGIHTGEPALGGTRYVGLGVHRAARICAAGHGGQVLVSQTTRELLRDDPISDVTLRDLGEHQLKDLDEPEHLYQVVATGLREDFPELTAAASAPFEGRAGELAEAAAEEMAEGWRRPRRRVLVGAAIGVAIAGSALGALLTHGGGSTADASITANSVGLLSASGRVGAEIPVGATPGGIAGGADAIWVSNTGGGSVSRVDPRTNDVQQTITVGGGPTGLAVTHHAVWVANGLDGTVSRIDTQANRESQIIGVGNGPNGVASGENAVWVTNSSDGTVSRIDPLTGRVTRTWPAVVGASAIAVGFRRVWIVSPSSGKVVVLDPRSGDVLREIGVGVDPSAVAVGAGAVWVANRGDDTVSRIDPRKNAVIDTISVGRGPAGVAAGSDAVWVTNAGDGTVSRFDPSSVGVPKSISVSNPPRAVLLLPQGAYVAVGSSGAEHRGGKLAVVADQLDSIDPAMAYTTATWSVLALTNDGLVGFRRVAGAEGIQLVPDLAVSLPLPSDGGRTYSFELRPGIRYSNGKLVQPGDLRRGLERVFQLGSPGASYYDGIVGSDRCAKGRPCDLSRGIVTSGQGRRLRIHLKAPDADFLTKLALTFASAVPAGTTAHDVGVHPVPATGPYSIARYDKKAKILKLVRNPRFREWSVDAQPQGYADSISVSARFGIDISTRVRAVLRGAADVAIGSGRPLTKPELEVLAERYPSQLHISTQFAFEYFFLNTRVRPFDDVRARRAVNRAFDRNAFALDLGRGFAPTCQILPPNFPGYRPTCVDGSSGVTAVGGARKLVRSAGLTGAGVTVWAPSRIANRGRYMVSVLDSLGFRARLKVVPVGSSGPTPYFRKVGDSRTKAQVGFGGWSADYPSAGGFIAPLFRCNAFVPASPDATSNLAEFCDRSLDAKMTEAAALQAQDPPAGTLLWQQVEAEILAQAPVVPTVVNRNVDFVSRRVGNYLYSPQWGVLLEQLWIK